MTDHSVTLTVPDYVYNRAQKIAEATARPLEEVLRRQIEEAFSEALPAPSSLPPNEDDEVSALKRLSDDALRSALTSTESDELDDLLNRSDQLMLRKAEAAALLIGRGYKVLPGHHPPTD